MKTNQFILHFISIVMMGLLYLTPLARTGQPIEVAQAIQFLLSPESSYVTGATLQVSGGLFM